MVDHEYNTEMRVGAGAKIDKEGIGVRQKFVVCGSAISFMV